MILKDGLILGIFILLSISQPVAPIHPTQGMATSMMDPYGAAAQYVDLLSGDTVVGNFSSDKAPVQAYIFHDNDYEHPLEFDPADAVYTGFGMAGNFQYTADSDSRMIMVAVNENNLTQYVVFHFQVIQPLDRNMETWIDTYPTFFVGFWIGGAVLVVLFWRWKRSKEVNLDFNPQVRVSK